MLNEFQKGTAEYEIATELQQLYAKLKEVLDPSVFEYTKELREINERIAYLQAACKHAFVNPETGRCGCCGKLVIMED